MGTQSAAEPGCMPLSKSKPGVMVYFEIARAIKRLSYEQKGRIFEAILSYAEFGEVPEFDDIALDVLWPLLTDKIDRDSEKYNNISEVRRNAAYKKWWLEYARDNGLDPDDKKAMSQWVTMQKQANDANADFAMQVMPTATAAATPTATAAATPTATAAATPTATAAAKETKTESKSVSETGSGKGSGGNRAFVKPMSEIFELRDVSNDDYAEQDRLRTEKIAMLLNSKYQ